MTVSGEVSGKSLAVRRTSRPAMLSAILVVACGGREADSGAWQYKADSVGSESDGSAGHTSWLRAVGVEGPEGAPRTETVILSFDCFRGNTSSTIMTDQALRQGSVEIRLTVDADPPRDIPAFAGTTPTGGQVVLTISQDSVLGILNGHQRALFEYADGAGSSRTVAEFPVAGLEKYRAAFLAACARLKPP
jgi:hypothetical protein